MSDEILHWSMVTSVEPTEEPVSLVEARAQCAIDSTEFDDQLSGWIKAARQLIEADAATALMSQTRVLRMDRFPCEQIEIPCSEVTAVSSIVYTAMDGTATTWSGDQYVAYIYSLPARVKVKFGYAWPVTLPQLNAVAVTFTAGKSTAASVSQIARQAILLLVAEWWKNREETTANKLSDATASAYYRLVQRLKWGSYP